MEPTLLIGDRIFVSKYTYGYSRHSFPFSPPIGQKRFYNKNPKRGDIVVFKTPADNRTDYIKRLIGLPGDKIQFVDGNLYLNEKKIEQKKVDLPLMINCGDNEFEYNAFEETLPEGIKYIAVYSKFASYQNSDKYTVPKDHYFFLGDNRDCSKDSRYLSSVGYVKNVNIVGKARFIFFSSDKSKGNFLEFWKWKNSIRLERFFEKIK